MPDLDIEKMYRQVEMNPSQRHLQNILWRNSPQEELKCIQLSTVTYGVASSSFLATRVLKELASNSTKNLLNQGTNCTGTLRLDRKNVPIDVKNAKLAKGNTIARYAEGIIIGKWRDKRDVSYISTEFENNMIEIETRRKEKVNKPLPMVQYNKYMSGIDRQDQMLSYYSAERKTIRWPKKLFMHFIDFMLLNAHHLFNKYSGSKMTLYEFRINVIKNLVPPITENIPAAVTQQHKLVKRHLGDGKKQISRRRCQSCAKEGKRTQTIYECSTCPGAPGFCLECSDIIHE
ncbi:hypothetical protein JTB14_014938 [Gonioctena quinquepunctata]|nr:hypothetical protein JTB14_014938 [Gonioctena quinquepunctata]